MAKNKVPKVITKCLRCGNLAVVRRSGWHNFISGFNHNKLFVGIFGKIKTEKNVYFNDKMSKDTHNLITRFNYDRLLVEALGKIEVEECLCPECHELLSKMTVAEFKKNLASSGRKS